MLLCFVVAVLLRVRSAYVIVVCKESLNDLDRGIRIIDEDEDGEEEEEEEENDNDE